MDSKPIEEQEDPTGGMAEQPKPDDFDAPLEERIVSKNWQSRKAALQELQVIFEAAEVDSQEAVFDLHVGAFAKYVSDVNMNVLTQAVSCLEAFLKKVSAQSLNGHQNAIIEVLCQKMLLTHNKPQISSKASESLLLIFETMPFGDSIETIKQLMVNKNVKVTANAINALYQVVKNYGPKFVDILQFEEIMLFNIQSGQKDIKTQSHLYFQAVYMWIGDVIVPALQEKVNKLQMEQLWKEFSYAKDMQKVQRLTRKQKAEGITEADKFEADDFLTPIDLMGFFGPAWMAEVQQHEDWKLKVKEFENVVAVTKKHKVIMVDFEPMFVFLNQEIRNVNVQSALAAVNLVKVLIENIKYGCGPYTHHVIEAILLMTTDKRQFVADGIKECLDVIKKFCTLDFVADQLLPLVTQGNQIIQIAAINMIETYVMSSESEVLENVSNALLAQIQQGMNDKDGQVRDNALHCMGFLMGRLGEPIVYDYVKELNPQKEEKLYQAANEINPNISLKPVQPKAPGVMEKNPEFTGTGSGPKYDPNADEENN